MSGVRPLAAGRLLRAGSLLTVLTLATGFLGYAFQVLMGRVLFRDDFVVLNALMAVVMVVCSPLASLGLVLTRQVALVRASGDGGRVRILYRAASGRLLLACVAGLAAIFVGSPVVRQYLRIRDDESLWLFGGNLVGTAFVFLTNAFLQGLQRFAWLGGLGVGAVVIKTGLCVVFATVFGWGLNGALGGVLAAMVCVCAAGAWVILADSSGERAGEQELPLFAVHLIPPLIAGNVAFVAMTQLDIVLVNHYFEPELSSRYTAAAILGKAVLYLPAGLATALYPMVVEDRARGQGSRGLATQAVTATLVLCGSAALAYRVAGSWIVGFLFGEAYAQAGHLLAMYGLAMVPMGVAILLNHFLIANGQTLLAWLFVAAALIEAGVIHVWHPGLESVIAVIAICNLLLAITGCSMLASFSDASHTGVSD